MRKLALLLNLACVVSATTFTGTLNAPDGTGLTGVLYLSLSQAASLNSGTCGGLLQVVPTYTVSITVTNGSLGGSPHVYGNDCMTPSNTYYIVQFKDSNGNTLLNDWWYIQGSTENIGSVVSVLLPSSQQLLGQTGVVVTTPTGNQVITQPPGTALSLNELAVTYGELFPDGSGCNTTYCQFVTPTVFANGMSTATNTSSNVYIGPSGTLAIRTINGTDFLGCVAGAPISGGNDGYTVLRTDTQTLEECYNGHTYGVALTLLH